MKQRKESENKGKERRRRERVTKGQPPTQSRGKQKENGRTQAMRIQVGKATT